VIITPAIVIADHGATGSDKALLGTAAGTLIAGINVRYRTVDARVHSRFGSGDIDTRGFGAGATLTWYDSTGFNADAQAQLSWYRGDPTRTYSGDSLTTITARARHSVSRSASALFWAAGLSLTPEWGWHNQL
jgi:fibronectin-binding autotransporter adhesin